MSVFEVIGPPMVGPSSSHTAGACRIGWVARMLLGEDATSAVCQLHGSFAATGTGHGTLEALTAGLLGLAPDDESLKDAAELAVQAGLQVSFEDVDLGPQAHPNSVRIHAKGDHRCVIITASSVGGGSVIVTEIDELPMEIRGTLETVMLWHRDTPGFLARVTAVLACLEINAASIHTSRTHRGENAITAIEIDGSLPAEIYALLKSMPSIKRVVVMPLLPGS